MSAILGVEGAIKTFGAVQALRGADLSVARGEVHAICGDNGAGKSTLIKLISGVEQPDAGVIRLRGEAIAFASNRPTKAGDVIRIHTGIGGGSGKPRERCRDAVRADIRNGYITRARAEMVYGPL